MKGIEMNNIEADDLIKKLNLKEHKFEGGYYKETYRSLDMVSYPEEISSTLPNKSDSAKVITGTKNRPSSTLIFYLLKGNQFSPLHKVNQDEVWHFYIGSSLTLYLLDENETITSVKLGNNISDGCIFHYVIKKDTWFCAEVDDKISFSLLGCTVAPGFEFDDFELGIKSDLLTAFPQHKSIIEKFAGTHIR
jgi:predicted cupin superfamily sugar epimerase